MLAALFLILAPAPPNQPLTTEYLVGNWSYNWCGTKGFVVLRGDGSLVGFDAQTGGNGHGYKGRWWTKDGDLHLRLTYEWDNRVWPYCLPVGRVNSKSGFEAPGYMGREWEYRGNETRIVFTRQPARPG